MEKRKVSLIIFYNKKGEILLQDREGISKWGEEWGFFGGKLEGDESPEEAMIREIKEELSFNLISYKYLGKYINDTAERNIFISYIENDPGFDQKEGKARKFFTIREAKKLKIVPGDYDILDLAEEYLKNNLN